MKFIKEVLVDDRTVMDINGAVIVLEPNQGVLPINNKWLLVEKEGTPQMIYTEMTLAAMNIAEKCHRGQKDKGGAPYIMHPLHIAEQMPNEACTAVALLHDTIEDSTMTIKKLKEYGFPAEVIEAVGLLTHKRGEPYMDYIAKIKGNEIARTVKIADLEHNSDINRIRVTGITARDIARLEKYAKALEYLRG